MNSTYTHEIFCPEILETHSINTLSEAFEQLKSLYQNDDNSEFENNQSESNPIPEK
ncbi:16144_t:CDS:1, partial [Funneliformis geosporum]